jgi:STE24 endopeptidase
LAALAAALSVLLGWLPELWWLALAVVILAATVGLAQIGPVLLLPLFYKLRRLDDAELLDRLNTMAGRVGARISGVYEMEMSAKTTATNAALAGLGSTRRVILGDTLRQKYSTEEIEAILAHELAHHVHNDIPKLIAVSTISTLAGLFLVSLMLTPLAAAAGITDVSSVRSLPLIALVIGAFFFATTPLTNWFSRVVEHQADVFALRLLPTPAPFLSMMEKLADQNLAEPEPSPLVEAFFYDHPHHAKRLRFARAWKPASQP